MPKTIDDALRPDLALAFTKANVSANRELIQPGEHHGTGLLRLSWDLKVGANYEQQIAHTIPWQQIALRALSAVNETTRQRILREAIADAPVKPDTIKAQAVEVATAIKGAAGKRQCLGKVTGEVIATEVALAATDAS